jgi:cytochrome c oxidase cbb3-type subunit 3
MTPDTNPAPHGAPHGPPELDPNAPERHALPSFDGIRELDSNPPRTWTVVYLTTLIAALGLLVAYPAIPFLHGGNSQGTFGWSSRAELATTVDRAATREPAIQARFAAADLAEAERDPALRAYAIATGAAAFGQNCAACHGTQALGGLGFPNLRDGEWLWGHTQESIMETLRVGIRWPGVEDTRATQMPAFGVQRILERPKVAEVTEHVLALSGAPHDAAAAGRGAPLDAENCAACHGEAGEGNQELGAPRLSDQVWLYGGGRVQVFTSIWASRAGVMPAFGQLLSEDVRRKLTIYVRSLGGVPAE